MSNVNSVAVDQDLEQKVINIVADVLQIKDAEKITVDSSFVEDLGADSLDQVELMMAIEAAFGCDIPDEDAGKIVTIKDAVSYINKAKAA